MSKLTNNKIDILHVVFQMNVGGLEMLLKDICKRENYFGIKTAIIEIGPQKGCMFEEINAEISPMYRCALYPKKTFVFRLAKLLRELKPKAVHHHAMETAFLSAIASKLARVPCIVETTHGVYADKDRHWILRRVLNYCFSFLITHRIVVSEVVRQSVIRKNKVKIISNGIDSQRFYNDPHRERTNRILSECGLCFDQKTVIVGHVGSLRAVKNHEFLVKVASKVIKASKKPVVFLCAGIGEKFEEIKKTIDSLKMQNSIILIGIYKNIPEFLSCCDVFFLPSKSEGHPIACLEAMAAGLPSVVSDISGLRDVVRDDTLGRKFPLGDENLAVEHILEFINNPDLRRKTGLAAQKFAKNNFSLDLCVNKYNKLYFS